MILEVVFLLAKRVGEHRVSCWLFWEWDVDSLLETTPHSRVQTPREVGSSENQNSSFLIANTLHLHEELSFDSPAGLVFIV